jgi:hypothetical protein
MSTGDQRQFRRVNLPITLRYRSPGELTEMWSVGTLLDLSAGGLRFTSLKPIEAGSRLEFQIVLSSRKEPYVLRAEILWEKQSPAGLLEYGGSFSDVTADQQAELDELIEFLTKSPEKPS